MTEASKKGSEVIIIDKNYNGRLLTVSKFNDLRFAFGLSTVGF